MKFSVIIVSWNTADITLKCLKTTHRFFPSAEIIIVDNASTDDTVSKIKKIIPLLVKGGDRGGFNCKLIINGSNLGYAKACNLGAAAASGDFLLFLNSDIEFIDASLTQAIAYASQNPDVAIIGLKMLNPDRTVQPSVFPPQTALNAFRQYYLQQSTYEKYAPSGSRPTDVFAVSGGALLVSCSSFHQLGGWNESYPFYFEDLDLCRQAHHLDRRVVYFPQSSVIHRHGASGRQLADSQNQWRRLIPGSQIYHGRLGHYIINLIIWSGQKFQKFFTFSR